MGLLAVGADMFLTILPVLGIVFCRLDSFFILDMRIYAEFLCIFLCSVWLRAQRGLFFSEGEKVEPLFWRRRKVGEPAGVKTRVCALVMYWKKKEKCIFTHRSSFSLTGKYPCFSCSSWDFPIKLQPIHTHTRTRTHTCYKRKGFLNQTESLLTHPRIVWQWFLLIAIIQDWADARSAFYWTLSIPSPLPSWWCVQDTAAIQNRAPEHQYRLLQSGTLHLKLCVLCSMWTWHRLKSSEAGSLDWENALIRLGMNIS